MIAVQEFDYDLVVVGGGPAGLMAAEQAIAAGLRVALFERMGSCGRKFLIAGKGGLNLTHAEPKPDFIKRYSAGSDRVAQWLSEFDAEVLRAFADTLGIPTMVGSSGRVFPSDLKAAPFMRTWLRRLKQQGVQFFYHQQWQGFSPFGSRYRVQFLDANTGSSLEVKTRALILAMGGGSWAKLGSDGTWVQPLRAREILVDALQPSNCGFEIAWSERLKVFAGAPIKPVAAGLDPAVLRKGELMLSEYGLEGSLLYALSSSIREALTLDSGGASTLWLDLVPDRGHSALQSDWMQARKGLSLSEKLRRIAKLSEAKTALYFEGISHQERTDADLQVQRLKRLPLRILQPRPMDEAISTAGGIALSELDSNLMLRRWPGVFAAGEMLAWDAPTGGYLLTACFASGLVAGKGSVGYLN